MDVEYDVELDFELDGELDVLLYDAEYLDGQLDVVKLWNDGPVEVVHYFLGVNKNC